MNIRLIQFRDLEGTRRVGIVQDAHTVNALTGELSVYDIVLEAIRLDRPLARLVSEKAAELNVEYEHLIEDRRILPPLDHPDPAHMLVTGTGLTHLGSADARDQMHKAAEAELTDSMRMFRMGLEGGKPAPGEVGVQPEWFYKGDGSIVVPPYRPIMNPTFSLNGGEEPEIVGLYVIGLDGTPFRVGFALGNEFSDHTMERENYLYLAHSKLRPCAFGPELRLGALPQDIRGTSRILRGEQTIWAHPFRSGEVNMSHTIANLEYHHFKYRQFRRPGDVHVHFLGTATLSFAEGVTLSPGDEMEIEATGFGQPLRNAFVSGRPTAVTVQAL